jgi:glycosyltransferase involved in cell wall biosynthesis
MTQTPHHRIRVPILPSGPWRPKRAVNRDGIGTEGNIFDQMMKDLGIEIEIIDPYSGILNPLAKYGVVFGAMDPIRSLQVLWRFRSHDMIISVFESGSLLILLLRKLFRFRVKVAIWDVSLTENWKIKETISALTIPRADAIFVLATTQEDYIRRKWKQSKNIMRIGHMVDTAFFEKQGQAELGYIFSIGNDAGRDFDLLLDAIDGVDVEVIIKTRIVIDPLKLIGKRVKIIENDISPIELRSLYSNCKFVVVPLKQTLNPSGVSTILEAGSMSKAVVVTPNTAIFDFIVPNVTAIVTDDFNYLSLRRSIVELLNKPDKVELLGKSHYKYVKCNSSIEALSARLNNSIRTILDS